MIVCKTLPFYWSARISKMACEDYMTLACKTATACCAWKRTSPFSSNSSPAFSPAQAACVERVKCSSTQLPWAGHTRCSNFRNLYSSTGVSCSPFTSPKCVQYSLAIPGGNSLARLSSFGGHRSSQGRAPPLNMCQIHGVVLLQQRNTLVKDANGELKYVQGFI